MIAVARKYDVRCSVALPSRTLKMAMPVWHHLGAITSNLRTRNEVLECLATQHGVRTVADCGHVADRIEHWGNEHVDRPDCQCDTCDMDRRNRGCLAPNVCARTAERALRNLTPVWNPRSDGNNDGLTLTGARREANTAAWATNGRVAFDPSVTQEGPLANVFRVFAEKRRSLVPSTRPPRPFAVDNEEVEVYLDGSCVFDADGVPRAGCGVWFGPDDPRNEAARVWGCSQTNQAAEVRAVELALSKVPAFAPLHMVTD
ncbi:hypothetical protein C2E23DRAFT_699807, partial [Lenzites betulinus]